MNATTVAIDLAKNVFQLAYADSNWKIVRTARLTRTQFQRCFQNSSISLVIMEACGCAHYWLGRFRHSVSKYVLLPARYIRACVKRNKTDAADAAALLEAARCGDIQPARIKSVEQQALQSLHRTRTLWMCFAPPGRPPRLMACYRKAGDAFEHQNMKRGIATLDEEHKSMKPAVLLLPIRFNGA